MKVRTLPICFLALMSSLLACKVVEVQNYIHRETEEARALLEWHRSDPSVPSRTDLDKGEVFIVPDFYRFWPGYSATAYVYLVTPNVSAIHLLSISISSPGSKDAIEISLKKNTSPRRLKNGIWLSRERVVDAGSSARFRKSKRLDVSLKWRFVESDQMRESTFVLDRRSRKAIAWVT